MEPIVPEQMSTSGKGETTILLIMSQASPPYFRLSFYKVYRSLCKDNINIIMCQLMVLIYRMKRLPTY